MEDQETEELLRCLLSGGITAVESRLSLKQTTGMARLKLLDSVREASHAVQNVSVPLDRMLEIYEACIQEALSLADGNEKLIEYANVTSYNQAANLADCWTDAHEPRSVAHFNAGVKAANRCLELRRILDKPPASFSMAYFILGVHEYSLLNYASAEQAWKQKLANEPGDHQSVSATEVDLNVLLSHGLIGLARWSQGLESEEKYIDSISRLDTQRNADNDKEVDLFINELRLLKEKHGPVQKDSEAEAVEAE